MRASLPKGTRTRSIYEILRSQVPQTGRTENGRNKERQQEMTANRFNSLVCPLLECASPDEQAGKLMLALLYVCHCSGTLGDALLEEFTKTPLATKPFSAEDVKDCETALGRGRTASQRPASGAANGIADLPRLDWLGPCPKCGNSLFLSDLFPVPE